MWIEWNGGECPITEPSLVRYRNGCIGGARPGYNLRWEHTGKQGDIVAYSPGWRSFHGGSPPDLIEERDQPNGEKSMAKTVQAFNAIYGTTLTEVQGWHFMELLKMTRSAYGVYVADDYEDKWAYAALAAEAAK